jgi:hypothetical protein
VLGELKFKRDVNYLDRAKYGVTPKGHKKGRPLKEIRLVCKAKGIAVVDDATGF